MRPPILRLFDGEIIVDSFSGGGGASLGIEMALGRSPDIAINHDAEALAMHRVNHPASKHLCEDVWKVDPVEACAGRPVGLMWLSPDCRHFSKAKGGKPVEKKIRGLAWIAVKWAKAVNPRVIVLENVEEFEDWGPLLEDGRPCPLRKGLTFRRFVRQLERCGYVVEHTELVAADYGAPTTRKRLFLVARRDGVAIAWPKPTHGKGRALPWRTAAECIEWSLPCPSIFERVRPLAENTLRRIARGIRKYVIDAAEPFIVPVVHAGDSRVHAMGEPMPTITGAHRGEHALINPFLVRTAHGEASKNGEPRRGRGEHPLHEPVPTVAASNDFALCTPIISTFYGDKGASSDRCQDLRSPLPTQTSEPRFALVSPTLIQTGYGEREGQAPRVPGLDKPLGTVVSGQKHGLVTAFLAKHYSDHGQQLDLPLHTVQAGGNRGGIHYAEVRAFLTQFYGAGGGQEASLAEPARTIRSRDCLALVTVSGQQYVIADIGMRMLQPRELYRAQGFPDSYRIEHDAGGKAFTKSAQVRMCGNSVCPPVAAAIIMAQFAEQTVEAVA